MRRLFLVILVLCFQFSFAHKPKHLLESSGTVKFYMQSSFNYAEFLKVKILAKNIDKLAQSLKVNDSIVVKYNHSYHEKGNDEYLLEYKKTKFLNSGKNKVFYMELRNDCLDVELILSLFDFSVKNKSQLSNYIHEVDVYDVFTSYKTGKRKITNLDFVHSIGNTQFSPEIEKLMNQEIKVVDDEFFSVFWKNGKYSFFNKNDATKSFLEGSDKELYYYQIVEDGMVVFMDDSSFRFIKNEGELSKKHELKCNNMIYYFGYRGNHNYELHSMSGTTYYYLVQRDKLLKEVEE
jgi:hypothetical protein